MSVELPMFDISKPLNESSLTSLQDACKEWGFFYVTNHGISSDMYQKLRRFSGGIFGLGDEEKMKMGASNYTPRFIASPFFESLRVSGPDFYASAKSSIEAFSDQATDEEFRYAYIYITYIMCIYKTCRCLLTFSLTTLKTMMSFNELN